MDPGNACTKKYDQSSHITVHLMEVTFQKLITADFHFLYKSTLARPFFFSFFYYVKLNFEKNGVDHKTLKVTSYLKKRVFENLNLSPKVKSPIRKIIIK